MYFIEKEKKTFQCQHKHSKVAQPLKQALVLKCIQNIEQIWPKKKKYAASCFMF